MAKKDTCAKAYMSQNEIFADVFNYVLFQGEQQIKAEHLVEQDACEYAIVPYKEQKDKVLLAQRVRDILKSCTVKSTESASYILLGIENQSEVNYAMIVRVMLYDALNYMEQVNVISKRNKQELKRQRDIKKQADIINEEMKQGHEEKNCKEPREETGKEEDAEAMDFLSGLKKSDRLKPVITIVVYLGSKEWDGPRDLYDMVDASEELKPYVQNYGMHLIIPKEIVDFGKFHSEFGAVMEFLKVADDKEAMKNLVSSKKMYQHMSYEAAVLLKQLANLKILDEDESEKERTEVNMCKAWDDWAKEVEEEVTERVIESKARLMLESGIDFDKILGIFPEVGLDKLKEMQQEVCQVSES